MLRPSFRNLFKNWWPSLIWLGVIRLESSDAASSTNTYGFLWTMASFLHLPLSSHLVNEMNAVLRKTGHFMGYGILAVLVFFALRNTNRDRIAALLRRRRWGTCLHDLWRMEWALLGVGVALITASFDEIHQSFIPSRSGRWQDVMLDTVGAVVLQIVVYFFSLAALNRRRKRQLVAQPEFSSTQ
ncbi:MAG: VanZ family protein [Candidatus Korobacteraceae bacterium]